MPDFRQTHLANSAVLGSGRPRGLEKTFGVRSLWGVPSRLVADAYTVGLLFQRLGRSKRAEAAEGAETEPAGCAAGEFGFPTEMKNDPAAGGACTRKEAPSQQACIPRDLPWTNQMHTEGWR